MADLVIHPPEITEPARYSWVKQWQQEINENSGLDLNARVEMFRQAKKLGDRVPRPEDLPMGAPGKGLVIGSVQSGKTGVMLGLAAHAFDNGYKGVIVLSGTKTNLSLQSTDRFVSGILRKGESKGEGRSTHPLGAFCHGELSDKDAIFSSRTLYSKGSKSEQSNEFTKKLENEWLNRAVREEIPFLICVLKHQSRAEKVLNFLREIYNSIPGHVADEEKWSFLIIDDEVDEFSTGETGTATFLNSIGNISKETVFGRSDCLTKVCYVGFTATPQAPLGLDESPLYPDNFIQVLKTPFPEEDKENRNELINYQPNREILGMYCGGRLFYEWFESYGMDNHFLVNFSNEENGEYDKDDIEHFFINYIVSGAIRLTIDGGVFPNEVNSEEEFVNSGSRWAPTHTGMINPGVGKAHHTRFMWEIIQTVRVHGGMEAYEEPNFSQWPFSNAIIAEADFVEWMESWYGGKEEEFRTAYDSFQSTYSDIETISQEENSQNYQFPDWESVSENITRVLQNLQFRLINSESTESQLDFGRPDNGQNYDLPPKDIFTIAVGGNLLSRGLTLTDLCTSFIVKPGENADTGIQRQRWFGYRGKHLALCRVHGPSSEFAKLTKWTKQDNRMRAKLAEWDDDDISPTDSRILKSLWFDGRASSKLATRKVVGHTNVSPYLQIHQMYESDTAKAESNWAQIREIVNNAIDNGFTVPTDSDNVRGHMLGLTSGTGHGDTNQQFESTRISELLERMSFSEFDPNQESVMAQKFTDLQNESQIAVALYRPGTPGAEKDPEIAGPDPYEIAAYLRLWHELYQRHQNGDDLPDTILDSSGEETWIPCPAPNFNVVIKSAGQGQYDYEYNGTKVKHSRRRLGIDGYFSSGNVGWGSKSKPRRDLPETTEVNAWDQWIDDGREKIPYNEQKSKVRSDADDGLLFIQLNRYDQGADTRTIPCIGIMIPDGGPHFIMER